MKTGLTIFFLVVLLVAGRTQAADITVDGSTCTLFDAITAANNNANEGGCTGSGPYGDDTITLQSDVLLTAFLPEIVSTITIEGQGHTIDGNDDSSVGTVLRISSAGDLTLNQATVTGGNASGGFGATEGAFGSRVAPSR